MTLTVKRIIHMIGDSTMADKPIPNAEHERGWGQILPQYTLAQTGVANHAKNGRSSRSFREEGLWSVVQEQLQPEDWLIIQFGHNDCKNDERYTSPLTTFKANLERYVTEAQQAGVYPVICTPIVRGGNLESHGDYSPAVKEVAHKLKIPLIDLEALTKVYVAALQNQKEFYIRRDSTHLNEAGAAIVCRMAVDEIHRQNLPLSGYLRVI